MGVQSTAWRSWGQCLSVLPGFRGGGGGEEFPGFVPELAASPRSDAGWVFEGGKPQAASAAPAAPRAWLCCSSPTPPWERLVKPRRGSGCSAEPRSGPKVPSHHPFPWAPEVPKGTAGTT